MSEPLGPTPGSRVAPDAAADGKARRGTARVPRATAALVSLSGALVIMNLGELLLHGGRANPTIIWAVPLLLGGYAAVVARRHPQRARRVTTAGWCLVVASPILGLLIVLALFSAA
jgi:hypothetical protein